MIEVYIILIDAKGVLAFQKFTREKYAELGAVKKDKENVLLFKIKLTYDQQQITKLMINKGKFRVAAKYLIDLRNKQGEAE